MVHVAISPRRGEGRLHNYWQYLGGKLGLFGGGEVELFGGGGGKLSCLGGGGEASPVSPSLDETLLVELVENLYEECLESLHGYVGPQLDFTSRGRINWPWRIVSYLLIFA